MSTGFAKEQCKEREREEFREGDGRTTLSNGQERRGVRT